MQKKFFSNLALLVALNLLVKPLAIFGIDAEVQDLVGDESYGLYFALLNFSVLFNILLDFGINNFTTKNIAQSPQVAAKYFGRLLTVRLILFVFYAIVSFTIGLVLGWNSYEMYLLGILVLNQFLITVIAFVRSYFGGFLLFKTDAIIGVLDRLLLIILCGAVIYFPVMGQSISIEFYIWIQTQCYAITLVIALILLFMRLGLPKLRYHRHVSWAIIRQSLPYALLILLMMIYSRVDSVMIERIHHNGKVEAGYYAKGFRLLSAFFMFAMLFSNLLLPMFSRMFKDRQNILPLLMSATRLLMGPAIIVAVISQFNSKYILDLIYNTDVKESVASFQLLMWSFIGMCSTVIFGTLLTANGALRFLNISSAIGLLVNFVINYLLIPKYGAYGAALATLITQSAISLAQIVYCYRYFDMRFSLATTAQFVLFPASFLLICYFFPAQSLLQFAGLLLGGLALLFLFRLIDLKEIRALMKA